MEIKITEIIGFEKKQSRKFPLVTAKISAGFPSPADDYIDKKLDLNEYLIKHPSATFFVRVSGDSMIDAGIHSGDILIVDRAINPGSGKVVIAVIEGEFTVKRIKVKKNKIFLIPENPQFKPIQVKDHENCEIWGVVTHVIHPL
ncbi:MAG: hypothetical protein APR63_13705 [Desulfuromonas sp. SDB]|nr:MAG: hypothetical protein APR63_13705 [Desulfuromonas sp. SDB]